MRRKKLLVALIILIAGLLLFLKSVPIRRNENSSNIQTQVIVYTPEPGDYPKKDGECWTSSIALQGRPDSLRCSVDQLVFDPCFRVDEGVICDLSPLQDGDEFELIYSNELPSINAQYDGQSKRFSWIYQLEDGSRCLLIQGTAGSINTGEFYYYICGENKVILGGVDKSSNLWKAEVGYLDDGGSYELEKRETQSVIKAWE